MQISLTGNITRWLFTRELFSALKSLAVERLQFLETIHPIPLNLPAKFGSYDAINCMAIHMFLKVIYTYVTMSKRQAMESERVLNSGTRAITIVERKRRGLSLELWVLCLSIFS